MVNSDIHTRCSRRFLVSRYLLAIRQFAAAHAQLIKQRPET